MKWISRWISSTNFNSDVFFVPMAIFSFFGFSSQVLWMKDCRENFKYKKSWISHKMMCTYKWVDNGMVSYLYLSFISGCSLLSSDQQDMDIPIDIVLPEFSDFAERMLTPVKEIAVVQLCGGIQKMEDMNRLLTIPLKVIEAKI